MGSYLSSSASGVYQPTSGSSDVESSGSKSGHCRGAASCPAMVGLYILIVITCLSLTVFAITNTIKIITIDLASSSSCPVSSANGTSVDTILNATAEPLIGGDIMNEIDG